MAYYGNWGDIKHTHIGTGAGREEMEGEIINITLILITSGVTTPRLVLRRRVTNLGLKRVS